MSECYIKCCSQVRYMCEGGFAYGPDSRVSTMICELERNTVLYGCFAKCNKKIND